MSNSNVSSAVGIIGQMYEERKSKKLGVLESREEKYKTLMMRDPDGKTFNITYSTFKSNWRKYNGEQIVQTSTQVEEQRTEEKKKKVEGEKREASAKKTVENQSEVVRLSTEEKVKRLRALSDLVTSAIKEKGYDFKVDRTSKGGICVRHKKTSIFQIWDVFKLNKYSFRMKENLDKFVKMDSEREVIGNNGNNIRHRVGYDKFDNALSAVLDAAVEFVDKEKKEKNEKKEKTK